LNFNALDAASRQPNLPCHAWRKAGGSVNLKEELCTIVNSEEGSQTLEQIAAKLAVRVMPEIKLVLDELSDGGAVRKEIGATIYLTTYQRVEPTRKI
jgi:hypothetical protein